MILCHQGFPHFEDEEKALKILVRALKPSVQFIISPFINLSQINDRHRKAGTAVANDMMPIAEEMVQFFEVAGEAGIPKRRCPRLFRKRLEIVLELEVTELS